LSENETTCPQVTVRVSVEDKKMIKKFGGNYAEIWRLGFDKWLENIPSEMQKKVDYYQKLLLHCNNNMQECNNIVITKNNGLDQICKEYIKTERPINNPDGMDLSWIQAKIKKQNLHTDVDGFLARCKELKGI